MEDVEEHLLTCQDMLLEIEQKASILSHLSFDPLNLPQENGSSLPLLDNGLTQSHPPHQNGLVQSTDNTSSRFHLEAAEVLLRRLDLLKSSLISFQRLLQDRQEDGQAERPLQRKLRRSSSVQEILSSPRNKLLRQNSLQQQKELEQELEEQRGLTQALSRHTVRAQREAEDRACPAESYPDSSLLKWDRLHTALLSLEHTLHVSPSEVADASMMRGDGAAGRVIGEQAQKELQSLVKLGRELEGTDQVEGDRSLDEGAFHFLSSVSLSLSALFDLLRSPVCVNSEEEGKLALQQIQSVSSELDSLRRALASLESKFKCFLRSPRGHQSLETVGQILPEIQTLLKKREAAMRKQLEETASLQRHLKDLHVAFTSNQSTVHQITLGSNQLSLSEHLQCVGEVRASLQLQSDQLSSLMQKDHSLPPAVQQEASQLQVELDSALLGVSSRFVDLKSSADLQQMFEQLVLGLKELLSVGSEKVHLLKTRKTSLQNKDRLINTIKSHDKFFQFLQQCLKTLQFLSKKSPENSQQTLDNLKEEVERLQEAGLETGTKMKEILQIWTQWELDCEWMDALLRNTEASFPIMPLEWDSDEQITNYLSMYQGLQDVLGKSSCRVARLLKSSSELQTASCAGVESVSRKLQTKWKSLMKRVDHERNTMLRIRKVWSRFSRDIAELAEWIGRARDVIDRLQISITEEDDETRKIHFIHILDLSKELEYRATLMAAVKTSASQLVRTRNPDLNLTLDQDLDLDLDKDRDTEKDQGRELVSCRVRQMEVQWSSLNVDVPALLQSLQKRWLQVLTQKGALQELHSWLEAAEAELNAQKETNLDLNAHLRVCKDFQTKMRALQAILDFINQPLQRCSTTEDHGGRCERSRFSEEQGRLNHRWLSLQHKLMFQVSSLEQQLQTRTEAQSFLQQVHSWIQERNICLDSNLRPHSRAHVQQSLKETQELEQKLQLQSKALQDLKKKWQNQNNMSSSDLTSQIDNTSQDCDHLKTKNDSLNLKLVEVQKLWDSLDEQLRDLKTNTLKISNSLDLDSKAQISLRAQTELCKKLQALHEEAETSASDWDKLCQTESSLKNVIHPSAAALIREETDALTLRWTTVSDTLNQRLQQSNSALSVWEAYHRLAGSFSRRLKTLQTEASSVTSSTQTERTQEHFTMKIQHIQEMLSSADTLQSDLQEVLDASKHLCAHLDTPTSALVQSETRMLSRGVLQLSQGLKLKLETLQEGLERVRSFTELLTELEAELERWDNWETRNLQSGGGVDGSGPSFPHSDIRGRSADLELLNELSLALALTDVEANRLLRLNQRWSHSCSGQQEAHSAVQMEALQRQSFGQRCESWMCFLQKMEDSLAVDVAGSYQGLRQQLCTHKRFQAELSVGHQILHSVISEALHLLQRGEVDDRDDFLLKLAALRQHWQGAVERAEQRRGLIEGLVRHWHLYHRTIRKLRHFLSQTRALLPPAGLSHCSVQELRRSLHLLQHSEVMFQRYQSSFVHTLEVGRQLFSMGDQDTQALLQSELATLQHEWDSLQGLLGKRMDLTHDIIKNWERCETGLTNSTLRLKDVKTRLNQSLPEMDEGVLTNLDGFMKDPEELMEDWAGSLSDLRAMKTDLSQYILADDVLLLQEQVDFLHCQWDELCLKVSLRKQEIADRLNAWMIFNEKNRELCEWLTQMENKVSHSSDLNIEEMVEKLKKDCMEEINLFSENKTHLKKLGEQLITATNKTKETEINAKLKDINDRWQHLFDHIQARVSKLKETLVTVQQLDKNMSNLRTWLSRVEAELSKPVVYSVCHSEEIHSKLQEQQELQRDIEQHTDSVASVLTLCDVLLHDSDACSSDSENDSLRQTTVSLDRRWRNICAMSMERRMRIEETWRLWCKFLDDYSRFDDWLKSAEVIAANPESENVLYTCAKEELKRFEAFQRQVHERLTQLELVNKQYRRLARENRTDAASRLKLMVQEGNQRWDVLQRRVHAVLRRLKHFTSQREEFEGSREGILVWLTEMDLQLTNVEHFSESDAQDKMRQLNGFQQEIMLNTNKIDALIVFGENLIQKSAPLDASLIEDELEELHSYCQEVFGRVARFHHRLVNRRQVLDDLSDSDLDASSDLSRSVSWTETKRRRRKKRVSGEEAGPQVTCHLLAPPLTLAPPLSGRETPVSVDSIPLEWDHTVDVGGSSSHEDDDDATFFSALSVKSVTDPHVWLQSESPKRQPHSTPHHTQPGYVKLMSECSGNIDRVSQVKLILNDEEELNDSGLSHGTEDKHTRTGVIERWELLRAHSHHSHTGSSLDLQHWNKLTSDLSEVTSWLGRVLPELDQLQNISPSTSLSGLEENIHRLKEMQRCFSSHKCLMISVNLSSRQFLHGDSPQVQELQDALDSANHSWAQACSALQGWELGLHQALCRCQEFHEALHALLLWLSQCEHKLYSVNIRDQNLSRDTLQQHRDTLQCLQDDLHARQQQVSSLQTLSSELLMEPSSEEGVEAKEKVHVIHNKLRLLLRQAANDSHAINARLEKSSPSSEMDSVGPLSHSTPVSEHKEEPRLQEATGERPVTRRVPPTDRSLRRPLLQRALRFAFPLHLLFLLLLVLACLVPLSEDQFSCALSNNFARSFYPMLRYTNGPPPT